MLGRGWSTGRHDAVAQPGVFSGERFLRQFVSGFIDVAAHAGKTIPSRNFAERKNNSLG